MKIFCDSSIEEIEITLSPSAVSNVRIKDSVGNIMHTYFAAESCEQSKKKFGVETENKGV